MDIQNKPNQENNSQRQPSEAQKNRRAYNRRLQAAKLAVIVLAVTALTTVCFLIPLRPTVSEAEIPEVLVLLAVQRRVFQRRERMVFRYRAFPRYAYRR